MRTSKLITILKALDEVETRQFYRYVRAPFFTKSDDVLNLYKYIRKFYPKFDTPKLERKKVYAKLFPKSIYDGPKLRNLILKLTKILEDYLIYVKCQQDSFAKKKLLTQIYGERNIYGLFEKNTNDLLQDLEAQPFRDATFFYDNYALQRDFYFHPNTPQQGEVVSILKKSLLNLQEFQNIERLQTSLELKNRERILSEKHDFEVDNLQIAASKTIITKLLKELINLVEKNENSCPQAKEASFFQAKALFFENIQGISPKNGLAVFTALVNYATWQISKQSKYIKEVYELYKLGIETKLLLRKNEISNTIFLNTCITGTKLRDFDFIEGFILEYEQFLREATRAELKALSLSYLYYHQSSYTEVIETLEDFRFSNILYKINAKSLLVRTYFQIYEKDSSYHKLVLAKCTAFSRFIRNTDSINEKKKQSYLNFISLLKKITYQKELLLVNSATKRRLLVQLNKYENILAREWIRKKIDCL